MINGNIKKIFLLAAFALLPVNALKAQIVVISSPTFSKVEMSEVSEWGGYIANYWSYYGIPPDYAAESVLPTAGPPASRYYKGNSSASDRQISGWISADVPNDDINLRGGSSTGYLTDIYAEVIPGSRIRVKSQGELSLNWVDAINPSGAVSAWAKFNFTAPDGTVVGATLNRKPQRMGYLRELKQLSAEVIPLLTPKYESEGKTYYRLGRFELSGGSGADSPAGASLSAGYGSKITGVEAYYIGEVLSINGGNNETWLVEQKLPKALSVKVADGETGTLTNNIVPITFTIVEPSNGAKFPNGQASISANTENGIAGVKLTLGTVAGTYKVLATCPAEHCTSGVKEVTFTETAVTLDQAIELQPYYCNISAFLNRSLRNGVRVKAINKFTGKTVSNRSVSFTLVSHPGGTGMELTPTPPNTILTNSQGIARAELTLGNLPGNYRISAVCQSCEGNQEVLCNVAALTPPHIHNESSELTPVVLKKQPIDVTLQQYIVEPEGITLVYVKGPPNTHLIPNIEAVPNTGGHQHAVEGRAVGMISPSNHWTDGIGEAVFSYTAGETGGQERIMINAPDMEDYGDAVVLVSVSGLSRLGPGLDYRLSGETPTHPSNHYGTQTLLQEIRDIASAYSDTYEALIYINDMSLINGGLFDHRNTWSTPHTLHRNGTSVDFDRYHYSLVLSQRIKAKYIAVNIAELADNPTNGINCRRINEDSLQTAEDLREYGSLAHFECPR